MSQWLPALAEALGAKPPRRIRAWIARFIIGNAVIFLTYAWCQVASWKGLIHSRCSLWEKGEANLLKLLGVQTFSVASSMTLTSAAPPDWILTRSPPVRACRGRDLAPRVNQTPIKYNATRARCSSRGIARMLLTMILDRFLPTGPVVIGIDDTIERRRGRKIAARGIYRDPVRSSHGHFVKTSGLRWLSLMAMVPVPWTQRRWAMPFLTILAPSERYHIAHGRRHKKLTDFARQAILQVRRWLPKRKIVVVADSSFAALDLIAAVRRHVCLVTRLRLDANLFTPAPKRRPGQRGRTAKKGRPLPKLSKVLEKKTTRWTRLSMPPAAKIFSETASWRGQTGRRKSLGDGNSEELRMQLSTLNQFKGKVVDIKKGVTTDHVRIDLGHGIVVTSSITHEAVDLMKLSSGDEVTVLINEADIVVGK